jgi:hypothetical protein
MSRLIFGQLFSSENRIAICLRIAFPLSAGVPLSVTSKLSPAGRPGSRPYCCVAKISSISGRRLAYQIFALRTGLPLLSFNGSGSVYVPTFAS